MVNRVLGVGRGGRGGRTYIYVEYRSLSITQLLLISAQFVGLQKRSIMILKL